MVKMSVMRGIFRKTVFPRRARRDAVMIASDEFLLPLTRTVPERGTPPLMKIFSKSASLLTKALFVFIYPKNRVNLALISADIIGRSGKGEQKALRARAPSEVYRNASATVKDAHSLGSRVKGPSLSDCAV